jgi:hypothetical protein
MLVQKDAWLWTRHEFDRSRLDLRCNQAHGAGRIALVRAADLVDAFLATRPKHRYVRMKLLKHTDRAPQDRKLCKYTLDAEKWAREVAGASVGTC